MSAIADVLKVAISPVATALGLFGKPKAPTPALPLPTITPRSNSVVSDALAGRRGSAANQTTGADGAESSTTAKKTLLGQ